MLPKTRLLDIAISPQHSTVFSVLLNANAEMGTHSILRVAGGWVRDTLLGLHSNDIDIALETEEGFPMVSGEHFAREVAKFQATSTQSKERTVSVIRVNPALSKHIETATVCVHNMAVEFCSLRTDDYTSESRIPAVRPATPHEDALRRDFTINALFYNLHTGYVEDFTTGLEDLRTRTIRCPMSPLETFTDDPLRLLRGVRFVGQLGNLGFKLDASIMEAVDAQILSVLQQKVSRERVGKEFLKMMSSPAPEKCLTLLLSMNLLEKILLVEVHMEKSKKKSAASSQPLRVWRLAEDHNLAEKEATQYWSAVIQCVVPLIGINDDEGGISSVGAEAKVIPILFCLIILFYRGVPPVEVDERVMALCMNGLKLSLIQYQGIRRMIECYNRLGRAQLSYPDVFEDEEMSEETKIVFFEALSPLSDASVVTDALKVVMTMYSLLEWDYENFMSPANSPEYVLNTCKEVWGRVTRCPRILDAHTMPLPIKGNDIRSALCIPPKEIGSALLALRMHMFLHPGAVDSPEDAILWVKSQYSTD